MDELIHRRELDDVDAGLSRQEVLDRTAAGEQRRLDQALTDLSAVASDEEIRDSYGVDMAAVHREVDWDQVWSLP